MIYGVICETTLLIVILYVPYVNDAFSAKPLSIYTLFPGLAFSMLLMFWEESRKFCIRNINYGKSKQYVSWFEANSMW